jgi:tetratricopeptide (TPR) repeat protein
MRGSFELAREMYERSREIVADLGPTSIASSTSLEASRVEMLAGDPRSAERELRRDYDTLESMGETYFRSTVAALLGHAIWAQGRRADASRFARIAADLADEDDVLSQITWRTVEAKYLATEGRIDEALALVGHAVKLAAETVDIELRADALLDFDDVLALSGQDEARGPQIREALELYELKGDLVLAEVARERLASLP